MNREVRSENSIFSLQVKKILIIGKYFSHSYMRERQKGRSSCHMCLLFVFLVKRNLSSQTTMSKSKKVFLFHSLKNIGSSFSLLYIFTTVFHMHKSFLGNFSHRSNLSKLMNSQIKKPRIWGRKKYKCVCRHLRSQ